MTPSLRSILRYYPRIRTPILTRYPRYRAMATSNAAPAPSDTTKAAPTDNAEQHPENYTPLPLPPAPADGDATQLDASTGKAIKLDHLGPMVVNRDGTLSRIANWQQMTEIERQNTLRILGKRNQLRREELEKVEGAKGEGGDS